MQVKDFGESVNNMAVTKVDSCWSILRIFLWNKKNKPSEKTLDLHENKGGEIKYNYDIDMVTVLYSLLIK